MSNSLYPDQARCFVGPDLGPNCLQRLSANDVTTSGERVNLSLQKILHVHEWSFHMQFMNEPFASFINFIWNDHECKILFII